MAFQQRVGNNAFGSAAPTQAITLTVGRTVAAMIRWNSGTITLNSVSDGSNSYTLLDNPTTLSTFRAALIVCKNVTSGGAKTITFTFSASTDSCWEVMELSGLDTTTNPDQHKINGQANGAHNGTDGTTSTNVTTTANGEDIVGMSSSDNFSAMSAGTGFTGRNTTADMNSETLVQSSAGAIAATFTDSDNTDNNLTGILTFFQAASASVVGLRPVSRPFPYRPGSPR